MKTLLQITSSLNSTEGLSSRLGNQFVTEWLAQNPGGRVVTRDLARNPVPHLTAERFQAFLSKPETRTLEQQAVVNESDALIEEIRQADVVVLGLPMYNFGLPSTLKAYFDHIARAGVSFRYTEKGPVGLLGGRKVYVFATRGGIYAGTPLDSQTTYVRDFLRFLGLDEVEFVYAEGVAMGEERQKAALAAANAAIRAIAERSRTELSIAA